MADAKGQQRVITTQEWRDAELIWDYHQMHHELRPCSAGIGLGSHDLGVASHTVDLYRQGLFPVLVFTGGNSPTTKARFPRGEAVHYREHALQLGVPEKVVLVEPNAANTGQNAVFSRQVLAAAGIVPESVLVVCKPYEERRSYATFKKVWPGVDVVCASEPVGLAAYAEGIGDAKLVIDMLVGALQRVMVYPEQGFTIPQEVPGDVAAAFKQLADGGFDSRLLRR
ncbi:YdcF family protein [Streptomyces sp. RLB3-17]|uniref:YdcF family protein n=1 Tax=Streptomyces sp. RLB3-17 TaxID=2594455 RepID=UPI001CEDC285|nr:YdcF family protein [Streptomyces sp. RLB3-17]